MACTEHLRSFVPLARFDCDCSSYPPPPSPNPNAQADKDSHETFPQLNPNSARYACPFFWDFTEDELEGVTLVPVINRRVNAPNRRALAKQKANEAAKKVRPVGQMGGKERFLSSSPPFFFLGQFNSQSFASVYPCLEGGGTQAAQGHRLWGIGWGGWDRRGGTGCASARTFQVGGGGGGGGGGESEERKAAAEAARTGLLRVLRQACCRRRRPSHVRGPPSLCHQPREIRRR